MTQRQLTSNELQQKIVDFFTTEFVREGNRQCVEIRLARGRGTNYDGDLRTWDRTEVPDWFTGGLAEIEQRAIDVIRICEEDATSPGTHRYSLVSRQHYGGKQVCSISMKIEEDETLDGETNLPPTERGQTGLMMRGFDQMLRTLQHVHGATIGQAFGIAKGATEDARELRKQNDELRKKVGDLEIQLDERRWTQEDRKREREVDDMKFAAIKQIGGIVASKWGGPAAGTPSRLAILVEQFGERLTTEQQNAIAQILAPEQFLGLAEIFDVAKTDANAGRKPANRNASNGYAYAPSGPGATNGAA